MPEQSDSTADVAEFEQGPVGPAPHVDPKVATGGASMAAATVIVFAATQFGIEVPGEVGAALATLIGFAAGYLR